MTEGFYTVDGLVADESVLKKEIYDQISPWLETKIARLNRLLSTFWMLVVFMLSPKMERITSPIRLLPSPPLPPRRRKPTATTA